MGAMASCEEEEGREKKKGAEGSAAIIRGHSCVPFALSSGEKKRF